MPCALPPPARATLPAMLLLALACKPDPSDTASTAIDPLSWPVDADGPYHVGFRSWEVTYDSLAGGERTISINAWYPTEDEDGDPAMYLGAFPDAESFDGATLATSVYAGGYPVHVHSHGYQGYGGTSADLMRHHASHGWIAVAPDHINNTLLDHEDPLLTAHYVHRPEDITAALDALAAEFPEANTDAVVMSGHSFGASYTTWASAGATYDAEALKASCPKLAEGQCSEAELAAFLSGELDEPRVVAAIPMAGAIRRSFFGDEGHRSVHAPFLIMSGTEDGNSVAESWDSMGGVERTWISLEGGCHQTFALGACETLDVDEGFRIVNAYALAFGRSVLLSDASVAGILDGSEEVSSAVTLMIDK